MSYNEEARADLCNAMWLLETLGEVLDGVDADMTEVDGVLHVSPRELMWAAHAYVQHAWQECEGHREPSPLSLSTMKTVAALKMQCVIDEAKFQPKEDA